MPNQKIRELAKHHGVRLWRVAEALGIQDSAFSRKLRHELSDGEREKIIQIINQLSKEV